ncbi:MAG: C4-dicarboxylate ABC transporter substrate-binding protein [Spirochaetae bacterium HGW-Spirochaetae-10]|nr:MAG: C4-dicarboxylate ABC transporter substrate-binding protein [Spirochaetae bacterium HGW-Spirochaetae-10]
MKKLLHFARKVDRINDRIGRFLMWLCLFMVVIASFNALMRYTSRFTGIDLTSNALMELQWYAFSAVFLLGAGYGLRHRAHVQVDVLFNRFSERTQAWIYIVGTVAFLIPFCIFMTILSIPTIVNSWSVLEMSPDPGGLPRFPIKTLLPISFLLLLLQGVSFLIENIARLRGEYHLREEEQAVEKAI